jgi:hypothetical protein
MKPDEIENLLHMFIVLFVVIVVMMTMNQFGVNMMTIVFAYVMLNGILLKVDDAGGSGGLVGMSLLDLDAYYDAQKNEMQFPGWNTQRDIPGHISDILVRLIVTMVLLTYFIKSGIFQFENLNPMKMYYA